MNLHEKNLKPPEVTTGPLSGSRKIYSAPEGHDDLRVPFREIALAEGIPASSSEAVGHQKLFRVYDTSGPYTDSDAAIDVRRGLPPLRAPWIEARKRADLPVTQLELARAGIVTARFPGHDGEAVAARLNDASVIVSPRFGSTRFSTHVFNHAADVDRALDTLEQVLTSRHVHAR